MADWLIANHNKDEYLKNLIVRKNRVAELKNVIADCDAALADQQRLIDEKTAEYSKRKIDATSKLDTIRGEMQTMLTTINAEGAHSPAEIAEYTEAIAIANS